MKKIKLKKKNIYIINKNFISKSQSSLIQKQIIFKNLLNTKIHYGPKNSPALQNFILGITKQNKTVYNIFFLITSLRKLYSILYTQSIYRQLAVLQGPENIGNKLFYYIFPWRPGFLTNFTQLINQTLIDKILNRQKKRHLDLNVLTIKKKPQLPVFLLSFKKYWPNNEARKLFLYHALTTTYEYKVDEYMMGALILPINTYKPALLTVSFFFKEIILLAKLTEFKYFKKSHSKRIKNKSHSKRIKNKLKFYLKTKHLIKTKHAKKHHKRNIK